MPKRLLSRTSAAPIWGTVETSEIIVESESRSTYRRAGYHPAPQGSGVATKHSPRPPIAALAIALFVACAAWAQTFEAASVKLASGGRPDASGGPGTKDPGRIHYANTTMQTLLLTAYDLQSYQLAGPGWLDTERYDIDAVPPPGATKAQSRVMLRNLLAERFQMKVHRETRELSGYALVAVRGGVKLKESTADLVPQDAAADPPPLASGKDRFFVPPRRPGMFLQLIGMTAVREDFRQSTVQELAHVLEGQLHRPVADATSLTGKYDFTLTYATDGLDMGRGRMLVNAATLENPLDIGAALRSQTGLQLESRRMPVEILVIDHAEKKPAGN
jgi:uncharacterized protein (TIGR03435 family)